MWECILITRAVSLNPPESEFVYFVANGFLVVGNVDGGAGGRRAHLGLEPWVKTRARYEVKSIDPLRRQGRRSQRCDASKEQYLLTLQSREELRVNQRRFVLACNSYRCDMFLCCSLHVACVYIT